MSYIKHFIPLESDPRIFTELMYDLGVSHALEFVDVLSLEDKAMLDAIPKPLLALILVLPPCSTYDQQKSKSQSIADPSEEDVVWLRQTINNACGLYAILHAVCNIHGFLDPASCLHKLTELGPTERIKYLENSKSIEAAYAQAAQRGSSEVPNPQDEVDHHYICLVKHSGWLYELDGDLDGPINRGRLEEYEDMLASALEVVKQYTESERDGTFGLLALVVKD